MENYFFALVGIGALCLTIILCRNIFDDVEKYSGECNNRVEKILSAHSKEETRGVCDSVKIEIDKLTGIAEKAHTINQMWPFFWTIFTLNIAIIVNFIVERLNFSHYEEAWFVSFYGLMGFLGHALWIAVLLFYMFKIMKRQIAYWLISRIRKDIESRFCLLSKIESGGLGGLFNR